MLIKIEGKLFYSKLKVHTAQYEYKRKLFVIKTISIFQHRFLFSFIFNKLILLYSLVIFDFKSYVRFDKKDTITNYKQLADIKSITLYT